MRSFIGAASAALAAAIGIFSGNGSAEAQQYARPGIWQGAYLGANVGLGTTYFTSPNVKDNATPGGVVGGVHGGYNWQFGSFVTGVEADYSGSAIAKTIKDPTSTDRLKFGTSSLGSIRGRAGWAFGNTMLFATLGYGWTPGYIKDISATAITKFSNTNTGVVFGGGIENKFAPNISFRSEVLRFNTSGRWDDGTGVKSRVDTGTTVVRGGLTYHF